MSENAPRTGSELRRRLLQGEDLPVERIARLIGLDPAGAEVALRDPERTREALRVAAARFHEARTEQRQGRPPSTPMASDPSFPTGVGMALVGGALLWEAPELVPRLALAVAADHAEDGELELAASYVALVRETALPGRDDAAAWAAQSLLVDLFQRTGDAVRAEELARDLAVHDLPLDLWREDDPHLPDDSLAWHGGAFEGGIPPRRDERGLSFEDVHDYLAVLLRDMRREQQAEDDAAGTGGG